MKLVLGIVQKADTDAVLDALTEGGYRATRLASTGGFRREGNTTLIMGVDDHQVDPLIRQLTRYRDLIEKRTRQENESCTL